MNILKDIQFGHGKAVRFLPDGLQGQTIKLMGREQGKLKDITDDRSLIATLCMRPQKNVYRWHEGFPFSFRALSFQVSALEISYFALDNDGDHDDDLPMTLKSPGPKGMALSWSLSGAGTAVTSLEENLLKEKKRY